MKLILESYREVEILTDNTCVLQSGLTPLHVASFMGCMNIVIFLLQHEANPDVPTVRGETPLHLAARANQTDIIRILLRNGAKVDARARVSRACCIPKPIPIPPFCRFLDLQPVNYCLFSLTRQRVPLPKAKIII